MIESSSPGNLQKDLSKIVRDWVDLLSKGEFEQAISLLDKPAENDAPWNADRLKEILLDYAWGERMPVINSPYQMDLSKEKIYFYTYEDGSGYGVEYELPMDGEWGDLTAQFSFLASPAGFSLQLDDLHVL